MNTRDLLESCGVDVFWHDASADISIVHGDCLVNLPLLPDGCVDAVITDPPYGCGKAEWDAVFPRGWFVHISAPTYIITGSEGLRDSIAEVGDSFVDVMSFRNLNGMTRSAIGFCNWLAVTVANGKPEQGWNASEFCVRGDKVLHPSPKPIEMMCKLISRVSIRGNLILDPFAGSCTTAVAAKRLGRRCICIELEEKYCEIGKRRLRNEPMPLFKPEVEPEKQTEMFGEQS